MNGDEHDLNEDQNEAVPPYESAVAVVGMAGRFPGAPDVSTLWRNLLAGVKGLRTITDEELAAAGIDPAAAADPHYVRTGGPVADLDRFDAGAFGLSPREAETMEPQHRLFLECSWEALESAGYKPVDPGLPVGVFGGCAFPDYLLDNVPDLAGEPGGGLLVAVGNERDSLTSLVSYKLGLRGPSLTVQTFCSTSLVAVHLACQSLLTYDCDLALAGGAFLPLPQPAGYRYEPGGITSPHGRVQSFGAGADGTVMGSGVGVVALKRMTDALAEGDVIHAVILGSAVNNDGRDRVGYTAPGVDGQAAVIETALNVADVKPESLGYVECHATGTSLGDSIELAAMSRVFRTTPETPTVLGSLKPSIGHLDRASGVTGLIRAALSVREGVLPGIPDFEAPNPTLAAAADRFTVLPETRPWPSGPEPRRAGVSSFGLGGTNAHVVLEQAPGRATRPARPGPQLLTFSAGDPAALDEVTDRLRAHLTERQDIDLADVAYTLQISRGHFALRRTLVVTDRQDALAALADPARWTDGETVRHDPLVGLVPGERVPDTWWAELARAVARLTPAVEPGGGALETLERGLNALGIRARIGAEDAQEAVTVAPADQPADTWLTALLGRLWLAGAPVDWAALHGGEGRRVELPTYPFQRRRYWVAPRPGRERPEPVGRIADPAQWTYLPTWRQRPLPTADLDEQLRAAGPWLVLAAEPRAEALAARVAAAGAEIAVVRPGDGFAQEYGEDGTEEYTVRPTSPEDFAEVLNSRFVAPRTVVHGFALAAPEGAGVGHFTAELDRGVYSAVALVRALAEDPQASPADLVLLTSGASAVVGSDLRHPEHSALAALAPSIAQENPHLSCRHLDLEPGTSSGVEQLLAAMVHPHEGPVAVRGGEVWLRRYERTPLTAPEPDRPLFRTEDTVLITGGLGDVGLVLARHLARSYGCRLVLTARTGLPPREQWQQLAEGTDRAARHIRNVLELEAEGAQVLAVGADVGDEQQMRAVVTAAVERFGGIDAVVHAAGVQDPSWFTLTHLADRDTSGAHFRAKVDGFHVLQSVLAGHAPEHRITLSSLSAVLGGIALGPYSAANAALDAYTRQARLAGQGRWTTVDWDTWCVDPARLEVHHSSEVRDYEMAPAEGVQVLERALAAADRIGQVVVSTGPIEPRIAQWVTGGVGAAGAVDEEERERHPRPDLATPYAEPAEGAEHTVAEIWGATLGVDRVGADDDFFELGGHSLMAIQLAAKIRTAVPCDLAATDLVEHPTVRRLVAHLGAA